MSEDPIRGLGVKQMWVLMEDDRHHLVTTAEAFDEFPEVCEMILKRFGYTQEKRMWLAPEDTSLNYEGASFDVSYCNSDEK